MLVSPLASLLCFALALDDGAPHDMVLGFVRDSQGRREWALWNASKAEEDLSRRIDAEFKAVWPHYEPGPRLHISENTWLPCFLGPDYKPDDCPPLYKMYLDTMAEITKERQLEESLQNTDRPEK
jgi:hypothetical protein